MADLLDPLTALADDGTGQLREKQTGSVKEASGGWVWSFGWGGGRGGEVAYVFWDRHLRGDDRAPDVAVRAPAACRTTWGEKA